MTIEERFESMKQSGAEIKKNGARKEEIMEAIAVAKFSKSATVISASSQPLEWLAEQED